MPFQKRPFTASDLLPGRAYRVTAAFTDYDGILHPAGESWRFIEKHFLPAEDGLTLIVETGGQQGWIRLQWRQETQGALIDHFSDFVE
jgi:hypothetical protein